MSTLYESYTTDNGTKPSIFGANWDAQTFTPSVSHTITAVQLKFFLTGAPGALTVSIRAVDGSHKPTGSDLCSGTLATTGLTTTSPGSFFQTDFSSGVALSSGTEYAIVWRALSGNSTNYINSRCNSAGTYAGGIRLFSSNSGSTWSTDNATDMVFSEYGDPLATTNIGKVAGTADASISKILGVGLSSVGKVAGLA